MQKRKPKDQKDDKTLDVTVIPGQTTETEALAAEAEKGYDLLVIGLDKTTIRDNTGFHPNIIAARIRASTARWSSPTRAMACSTIRRTQT